MNGRLRARLVVRNVGWNLVAQLWLLALAIVAAPYVIEGLGVEAYGLYTLVFALIGWFAVLDLGLGVATVKYISEERGRGDDEAVQRVVGTSVTLYVAAGALGAAALAVSAPVVARHVLRLDGATADLGTDALQLAALGFLVAMPMAAFTALPVALQRLDLVNRRSILFGSASVVGTVGVLAAGFGLLAAIGLAVVVNGVAAVAFWRLSGSLLPEISLRPSFHRPTARRLIGFGTLKFLAQASTQAVYHLDKLIVGALLGLAAAAFYAIPVLVAQRLVALVANVATAFLPAASDLHGRGDAARFEQLYLRSSKLVALLVFPSAALLALYAEPILHLWLGEEFARNSAWPLRLLAVGYAVNALTTMPALAADSIGRPRVPAAFSVASAALNVVLSLALIPPFGLVGASAAILLTSVVLLPPFLLYVHRRVLHLGVWNLVARSLARPALAAALAGLPAAALVGVAETVPLLAACALASVVTYLAATVLLGVYDRTDRDVIRSSLARVQPEAP